MLNEQKRPAEAREVAVQASALDPYSVDAWFVLAQAQEQLSDWPGATQSLNRTVQLQPDFEPGLIALSRALASQGLTDDARATIVRCLALNADSPRALFYLGNIESGAGRWPDAVASYRRAVTLLPNDAEMWQNLARAQAMAGQPAEAVESLKRAVTVAPGSVTARATLGTAHYRIGNLDDAVRSYRSALALAPNRADLHDSLGLTLLALGDKAGAAQSHRKAIELKPGEASYRANLGLALGREEAISCYRRALELDPKFITAHSNLGVTYYELAEMAASVDSFRAALALDPERIDVRSKLLFVLSFDERCTPRAYRAEAETFGRQAAARAKPFSSWPSTVGQGATAPLRIGLVSADLRTHPVGHFLEAILKHLPAQGLELFAYSTDPRRDALTERIQPHFRAWRSLVGMVDETAARTVHDDGIHVLLDLVGHTGRNMLSMLAWRPAPVQASWLGYFASTGLAEVDYVIADPHCLPAEDEGQFVERVWRLPETRYCFTPPREAPPAAPLPALATGQLCFGSFQNMAKLNAATIERWSEVLRALPTATLRIQSPQLDSPTQREVLESRFQVHGIGRDRLRLLGAVPREAYLAAYAEVDVVLDTAPYTGGTTTCEALWMGVPTLTMDGHTMLTRQGASILRLAGLDDWVVRDGESFAARACALVSDLPRLAALRGSLRDQVARSPLFDAPRFAIDLAQALKGMWARRLA
ncbi:MAG: tetratricopeptide repeat protein [Burkholderiales bacterium]|nr:tetratricopeptide repeat protein [Burkholderiales bacterium]